MLNVPFVDLTRVQVGVLKQQNIPIPVMWFYLNRHRGIGRDFCHMVVEFHTSREPVGVVALEGGVSGHVGGFLGIKYGTVQYCGFRRPSGQKLP